MKNFVQIGANVGNDYFYNFCVGQEKSNIYLIEPNGQIFDQLKKNYKSLMDVHNVLFFNNGIVTEETKSVDKLYLYNEDSGLASIINRKSYQHVSSVINFNPITFEEFCNNNNISDIELLFIDTEGFDYAILDSIDLNKINIKSIIFEKWPYEQDDIDDKVKTGQHYLDEVLKKYKEYSFTELFFPNDGMINFKLDKIH